MAKKILKRLLGSVLQTHVAFFALFSGAALLGGTIADTSVRDYPIAHNLTDYFAQSALPLEDLENSEHRFHIYLGQRLLQKTGSDLGTCGADSQKGQNTKAALAQYQQKKGISVTSTFNAKTLRSLLHDLKQRETNQETASHYDPQTMTTAQNESYQALSLHGLGQVLSNADSMGAFYRELYTSVTTGVHLGYELLTQADKKTALINHPIFSQFPDFARKRVESFQDDCLTVYQQDALFHSFVSYVITKRLGSGLAKIFGDINETLSPYLHHHPHPSETLMDFYNNKVGHDLALNPANDDRHPADVIFEAFYNGDLMTEPPLVVTPDRKLG